MWRSGSFRFIEMWEDWMRLRWLFIVSLARVKTCLLKKGHLVGYINSWI